MDLGIKGKRALVCARHRKVWARAAPRRWRKQGVGDLVLNARGAEALEATAEAIRTKYGVEVTTMAADITSEEGRAKVLEAAGQSTSWSITRAVRRPGSGRIGKRDGFHQGA